MSQLSVKLKLCGLAVFLLIVIIPEVIFYKQIFEYSVDFSINYNIGKESTLRKVFYFITDCGAQKGLMPIVAFVSIFLPLNKVMAILVTLFSAIYIDNIMKIIYGSERPYWMERYINDPTLNLPCSTGFGNPSGHSFVSTATYLSIWHALTSHKFFKKNNGTVVLKYVTLAFFICFILLIMFSRVFLGAHSLDQIFYGAFLGAATYFFFFWILELQKNKGIDFLNYYYGYKFIISGVILSGIALSIVLYFSIPNTAMTEKYRPILEKLCKDKLEEYRMFNNDGLFGSFTLFALLGIILGLIFLKKFLDKYCTTKINEFVKWEKAPLLNIAIRIIVALGFVFPGLLFLINTENLVVIFVVKTFLCFILVGFSVMGPGFFLGFLLANKVCPWVYTEEGKSIQTESDSERVYKSNETIETSKSSENEV